MSGAARRSRPIGDAEADLDAYVEAAAAAIEPGEVPLVVGHALAGIPLEPWRRGVRSPA